jgi:hypothetical protein
VPGTAFDNSEKSAGNLLRKNASFLFPFFFFGVSGLRELPSAGH